jgi:hypothetical protein
VERSVARKVIFQSRSSGKCSRRSIATLYGSCPVEAAAHQRVSFFSACRRAMISGIATLRRASKGWMSRKKLVSFVVIPSTASRCIAPYGSGRILAARSSRVARPFARASGARRDSRRYSFPGSSTIAERASTSSRK